MYLPQLPDVVDERARAVGYLWTTGGRDDGARGRTLLRIAGQREGLDVVDVVTDTAPIPDLGWLRAVVDLRGAAVVVTPNTRLGHVVRFLLGRRAGLPVLLAGPASADVGLPEPGERVFAALCADWLHGVGDARERWRRWTLVRDFQGGGQR